MTAGFSTPRPCGSLCGGGFACDGGACTACGGAAGTTCGTGRGTAGTTCGGVDRGAAGTTGNTDRGTGIPCGAGLGAGVLSRWIGARPLGTSWAVCGATWPWYDPGTFVTVAGPGGTEVGA